MKISVIVPVYNVEKYLSKCLESLVNQTLKDIEIIVVNDGSPDNSQDIIDQYVNNYPNKIKSYKKKNGGQGSARNYGLKYAMGDFISFVDSDDWLELDALEKMYKKAIKEKSDIVICDMIDHFEDDGSEKYFNCTKYNWIYEVTPSASNKIFRRSLINDIRFLNREWYEDFNFTTKLLLLNPKISTISKGYYHCHARRTSTMNNNNSIKNLDMITVIDDLKKYALNKNLYDENLFSYLIFNHILITSINRVSKQKSKDVKSVINKFVMYCKSNIPNYKSMLFYNNIPLSRKIIANLNYNGHYKMSKFLLTIKSKIK